MSDIQKVETTYDESQIQVLEGWRRCANGRACTSAPPPRGLHHLVYEIVDNAIDEALAGYCTDIEVDIHPGNVIRCGTTAAASLWGSTTKWAFPR